MKSNKRTGSATITAGSKGFRRAWPVDVRVGGGVVLPRVTAIVRDERFESDGGLMGQYRVAGPTLLAGVGPAPVEVVLGTRCIAEHLVPPGREIESVGIEVARFAMGLAGVDGRLG